jgi:hypothetical protein
MEHLFLLSEVAQMFQPCPTPDLTNIHGGNDYDFAHNIIMDVLRGNSSPIFPDSNEVGDGSKASMTAHHQSS